MVNIKIITVFVFMFSYIISGFSQISNPESAGKVEVSITNMPGKKNFYLFMAPIYFNVNYPSHFIGYNLKSILRIKRIVTFQATYTGDYNNLDIFLSSYRRNKPLESTNIISGFSNWDISITIPFYDKLVKSNEKVTLSYFTTSSPEYRDDILYKKIKTREEYLENIPMVTRESYGIDFGTGTSKFPLKTTKLPEYNSGDEKNNTLPSSTKFIKANGVLVHFSNAYTMASYQYLYLGFSYTTNRNTIVFVGKSKEKNYSRYFNNLYFQLLYAFTVDVEDITVDASIERFMEDQYYYGNYQVMLENKDVKKFGFRMGDNYTFNNIFGVALGAEIGWRPGFAYNNRFYINLSIGMNLSANIRPFMPKWKNSKD